MVDFKKRINILASIYGSQRKLAKTLGVSQSTISRAVNKKNILINKTLEKKINSRYNYRKRKYLYQPKALIRVEDYTFPIWVSGNVVEIEDLEDSYADMIADLGQRYDFVQLIKTRVRRFDAE